MHFVDLYTDNLKMRERTFEHFYLQGVWSDRILRSALHRTKCAAIVTM